MARPPLCKSPGCGQVATRNGRCAGCWGEVERRATAAAGCTRCGKLAGEACTGKQGTHRVRVQRHQQEEHRRSAALMATQGADLLEGVDLGALFGIDLVVPPEPGVSTCGRGAAACIGASSGPPPMMRRTSTFTTGCPGAWE